MEPLTFLWVLLGITALATGAQAWSCARRATVMRRVAKGWGMTYVHCDRFRLAARIAPLLTPSGGENVTVSDVMYQTINGRRRYLFTVDFAEGQAASQRTRRCVAAVDEVVVGVGEKEKPIALHLGGEGAGGAEGYEKLRGELAL